MKDDTQFITDPATGLVRLVFHVHRLKAGEVHEGGTHKVDHGTYFHKGAARVEWGGPENSGQAVIEEGRHVVIRADTQHKFTALRDTEFFCFFTPPVGYEKDLEDFWHETDIYDPSKGWGHVRSPAASGR